MDLRNDTGLYVAIGLFTILVFATALTVLLTRTPVSLDVETLPTLALGFTLFMGSYFVAMAIYLGVQRLENAG